MKYAIFDTATGEIKRVISCPLNQVEINCAPGESFIESDPDDATQYVDVVTLAVAPIPNQPSKDHQFDFGSKTWIDPRTLAELKAAKWLEIKNQRDTLEESGFPYLGKVFDSDSRSVQRITVASQAASAAVGAGAAFSITWKCADNSFLSMDGAQMMGVPVALAMYGESLHTHAADLLAQIEAATTPEGISAISW